jgi:membrane associated rhomboid family serine protease
MTSIILIIINLIVSYRGFKESAFYNAYEFEVERVLVYKDYKRIVTSGFLHINWMHLGFNMLGLYLFSSSIESYIGIGGFLLIYFVSLTGGNLLALLVHRNDGDYSSVGASGAVCGIIFASIALFPDMSVGFFLLPISFPGWLYGMLFVIFSIYGIKSKKYNIGHEAHLGGALVGMLVALIFEPAALVHNFWTILIILVPILLFIFIIMKKPHLLLINNFFFNKHKDHYSIDHKYNENRHLRQKEIDRILDKISKSGLGSLSAKERKQLDEYSRKIR